MYRNLVNQRGSLTVTLPKDWITQQKLNAKDQVFLLQTQQGLLIQPTTGSLKKNIEFDAKNFTSSTLRSFIGLLYRSGYDEVNLSHVTKEMEKKSFSNLVGCVVTNNGNYTKVSFHSQDDEDILSLLDKMMTIINVALESEKVDVSQFRFKILELKDYIVRCLIRQTPSGLNQESIQLSVGLSDLASSMNLEDFTKKQFKESFSELKNSWYKKDFTTLQKISNEFYNNRKGVLFYNLLYRVSRTAANVSLLIDIEKNKKKDYL